MDLNICTRAPERLGSSDGLSLPTASSRGVGNGRWSVVLPFFNESDYLKQTLESLSAQTRHVRIILVDNGSTDDSAAIAQITCRLLNLDYSFVTEHQPGKVAALARGLRHVQSEFVATCDADTWYPQNYLAEAEAILSKRDVVAAGAYFTDRNADALAHRTEGWHIAAAGAVLVDQCHTGGAGQAFRTTALRAAGGFDPVIWNWILEDHEVMHRVAKQGHIGYTRSFWCAPSTRHRERPSVRWTIDERILYHLSSASRRDWFFYEFLARRLEARRLPSQALREARHQQPEIGFGVPDSLRG